MTPERGRFDGVLHIIRYNGRFYAASFCTLVTAAMVLWFRHLPRVVEAMLTAAASVAAFWTLSSLLVSYYVYDYMGVTRWQWLPRVLTFAPRRWLNIHSGLDESTSVLMQLFPGRGTVVDIYDPREMTEPSIARARALTRPLQGAPAAVAGKLDALPLPDDDHDTVFLLFAAHEIRDAARRRIFLREAARVLANTGQLVLVEHLRDWKNFIAFGPGFFHFYSRHAWLRVARDAQLIVEREEPLTPFVRCFVLRRQAR